MKRKVYPFIKNFSIYSGIILLLSIATQHWVQAVQISNTWPFILLFLYLFTLFAFIMLSKYTSSKLTYFANAFMLVNFGKLLLFSVIIVIYAWLNHEDAIRFTLTFFIYYLLLTSYEVIALLKRQKPSN